MSAAAGASCCSTPKSSSSPPNTSRRKKWPIWEHFGNIFQVKQSEKHFGPHSDWFWDVERSGGRALMDIGGHGIAFCYWFLNRRPIRSVYCHMATLVHGDKTRAEDNALYILEFEGGAMGIVENSWSRRGGMDDSYG